jgi:hypothetical protein
MGVRFRNSKLSFWIDLVSAMLIAVACWHASLKFQSDSPLDYYQFWVAGQAATSMEIDTVYSASDRRIINRAFRDRARMSGSRIFIGSARSWRRLELAGTPFLYSVFYLASSGDFEVDYRNFRLASLSAFAAGIISLGILLKFPLWAVLGFLILSTHLFWPFHTDIRFANVNQIQLGLLVLFLSLLRKNSALLLSLSGFLLGLMLCFKPNLAPVLMLLSLYWVLQRQQRRLSLFWIGIVAAGLVGLLLPAFLFGSKCSWLDWQSHYPSMLYADYYLGGGFLGKLIGTKSIAIYTGFGIFLSSLLAGFAVWVRQRARAGAESNAWMDEWTVVFWGMALYFLSGPVLHSHYFVLMLPWVMLSLRPGARPFTPLQRKLVYWFVSIAWFSMAAHPIFRDMGLTAARNHSLVTFAGVWILFALSIVEYHRGESGFEHRRAGGA